jgi:twitching motility protein PilT
MSDKKAIPLVARLAIQLEMLTPKEVERGLAESASSGNPRLAQVFLQMGLLDRDQVLKLQQVQKDLVERHRAKRAGTGSQTAVLGRMGAPPPAPATSRPGPADAADEESIHRRAAQAARAAAPMTTRDVDALAAAPEEARSQPAARPRSPSGSSPPVSPPATSSPAASPPPAASRPASSPASSPAVPQASEAEAAPAAITPAPAVEEATVSLEIRVPTPGPEDRSRLETILTAGVRDRASDIHLHTGGPIKRRIHGELIASDEALAAREIEGMVAASLSAEQRAVLARDGEIDFCFDLPGVGRFRANAYRQQRGLDVVFRSIPDAPPTLESLGLPADLAKYTNYHQGMVLVTGPAGCGKSSTMAALVDHINQTRDEHILTIEDPIEVIHPSKRCLVNQRHAGHHTTSFSRALRGALREDPDIIVIGELRDLETISLAMTAAETGHFVLASLHTANAVRTVNRMIGAFPSNEQDQVRAMLSESLRAVISQRLVPTADGQGRVAALELLIINRAIGNLIRDEKTIQIRSSMQTGRSHGMYLLEQSLNELVAAGRITREIALELAEERKLITAGA